ncbi:MAG: pteridine reductase [Lysobacter sp.]|nr:pteridine reductase [Lysobacter sp.]
MSESRLSGPGPVALVTGAARRIGASIARALHADGFDLALHYRDSRADAEALATELEHARAGSTLLLPADLADVARLPELVLATVDRYGRLDALVNNASAFFPTPLGACSPGDWQALFAVNAQAPFFLAQAAAPHLAATRGAIVNLADIHAERPLRDHALYGASKAALLHLTQALALALAPRVRVNAIAPGAILWPEDRKPQAAQDAILARVPLARTGAPEEIAEAVRWLLRGATYTTGQVLRLDGGRSLVG